MIQAAPKTPPKYTLDDLYLMVASIYAEQNSQRSPSSTFAHFVEVCGMLTIHDRKKKREGFGIEDALCKALGWFFPLMAKFRVVSVEDLIFRKYPYVCPYCRENPHRDSICKTTRGSDPTVDHAAVQAKIVQNRGRRPQGLSGWQQMFDDIYPRDAVTLGTGRSTMGLFEELGELAEAVRVFEKYPKYFAGEAADVFSYLMGIANEHRLKAQLDDAPAFDFEALFLRRYPGMCVQCGHQVCVCPSIPESTVGRLAKELDLNASEQLFGLDPSAAEIRGKEVGESVLQELGGLPAIAHQLPLDRGEANHALVLLCLKLSNEVQPKDDGLAKDLKEAAIQIASDTRNPGSRTHGEAPVAVLELLGRVWPLLNLAVIPQDGTLPARLGKLLRVQSVRIGVVTALPKEFAAMRTMLDEESPISVAGDPNDYVLGRIPSASSNGDHLVVVTLLKEMGNNSAAAAATHLLRSFPNVEDVLMVGIAGGIPLTTAPGEHVRLGDVVVSNKEGVIQYDNLKIESKEIKVRSNSTKPSARMIGAINLLEADRLMKKYPWEGLVARAGEIEGAARPSDDSDKLFELTDDGEVCLTHPIDTTRRTGQPKIHYGRIGAANILLKNKMIRDHLRATHAVKAVEMEGSGIADATWNAGQQYLVIRGICDYCDDKKNDVWQGYAAAAAAAYARAVIAAVNPESYQNKDEPAAR